MGLPDKVSCSGGVNLGPVAHISDAAKWRDQLEAALDLRDDVAIAELWSDQYADAFCGTLGYASKADFCARALGISEAGLLAVKIYAAE